MDRCIENCFEFLKGSSTCTATVSERRFISKLKRLSEKHPDIYTIDHENDDGSIVAHFPVKFLSFRSPKSPMTEEQKEAFRNRFKNNVGSK